MFNKAFCVSKCRKPSNSVVLNSAKLDVVQKVLDQPLKQLSSAQINFDIVQIFMAPRSNLK